MTTYMGDGDPVSFAAASLYPLEPSPLVSAPQSAQSKGRRGPRPARPHDGGQTPPSAAGGGRRCPRGPPPDDDALDALDIPPSAAALALAARTSTRPSVAASCARGSSVARRAYLGPITRAGSLRLRRSYQAYLLLAPRIRGRKSTRPRHR